MKLDELREDDHLFIKDPSYRHITYYVSVVSILPI